MTLPETNDAAAFPALRVLRPLRSVGAVLALCLAIGCGKDEAAAPAPAPQVTVDVVTQASVPIRFEFSGSLKAVKSIEIIPQVSGVLEKRFFDEGAFVEEGADLYVIDERPMEAQLAAQRAQLEKDRAQLAYLRKEAERYSALYDQEVASKEQRDSAVSKAKEFEASARLDEAGIRQAEIALGYTRIAAPFAGRIQETRIDIGQTVTAQQTVLTELVQIDPVYAEFSISREELSEIQKHAPGGIGPEQLKAYTASIELPDGTAYPKEGQLDFLSAQIDPTTDTLGARAVFANTLTGDSMILIPGQYARIRLTVGQESDAILVPQAAVVEDETGKHVLVVGAGDEVEARPVEVGRSVEARYVVEKGLKPGERVIVDGLQKAKPGKKVTPMKKGTPPGSPVPGAG